MASIYKLEKEYIKLLDKLEQQDGVLEQGDEEALSINIDNFETKVRNYYYLIKHLTGDISLIDDEVARLKKLKEVKTNLINRLKTTVKDSMLLYGNTGKSGNKTLDLGDLRLYTRNTKVVHIENEEHFLFNNFDYVDVKLDTKFDKVIVDKVIEVIKPILKEYKNADVPIDTKYFINKKKLKEDLKAAVKVDGANLINNTSVIFK